MIKKKDEKWLREQLARFSVKSPPEKLLNGYAREVMEKVYSASSKTMTIEPLRSGWRNWFRIGLTLATATAGLLLLFSNHSTVREAQFLEDPALYKQMLQQDDELLEQLKQIDEARYSFS